MENSGLCELRFLRRGSRIAGVLIVAAIISLQSTGCALFGGPEARVSEWDFYEKTGTAHTLNGISLNEDLSGWAVGYEGTVLKYSEEKWELVEVEFDGTLFDVVVGDEGSAWAVGENGTVLEFDGEAWKVNETAFEESLNAVDIGRDGSVWAAGENGLIIHLEGDEWTRSKTEQNRDIYGIHVESEDLVYAVGENGTFIVFEEGIWTDFSGQAGNASLNCVDAFGDRVYASGFNGSVVRYQNGVTEKLDTDFRYTINGICFDEFGMCLLVGSSGAAFIETDMGEFRLSHAETILAFKSVDSVMGRTVAVGVGGTAAVKR